MPAPSIDAIRALDGRVYAMLSPDEEATFDFYAAQGRKFEVAVRVELAAEVNAQELAAASSWQEIARLLKASNSRVVVSIGNSARALWDAHNALLAMPALPPLIDETPSLSSDAIDFPTAYQN